MQSRLSPFLNRKLFTIGLLLCMGLAVYLARVAQIRRLNAQLSQAYGLFTAQQMLDRTQPLLPRILPEVTGLRMFAHPEPVLDLKSVAERHWIVDCTDEAEQQIASIHWNADNGRVCRVMRDRHYLPNYRGRTLSKEYAAQIARNYLSLADGPDSMPSWQLEGSPDYLAGKWSFRFRADDQRAYVLIDETVEDMTVMQVWQAR